MVLEGETTRVPLVACVPLQPPLPVHELAFAVDQARVVLPPDAIDPADALKITVGAGVTAMVALACAEPPAPLHVSV